jgi:electron transfer flavoprotein beta subunit
MTVMKGINEPRYPNFLGIRKASKAEIPEWTVADLGVELPAASTAVVAYKNVSERSVSTEIIEGASVQEKAEKLANRLFEEKVL